MKTSNKLILSALLLVMIFLFAYDYLLKEAYVSGNYKHPYKNFVALKFKDFDTVDLASSTAANAKFVQGPFSVRIDSNFLAYVKLKQKGRRLQVNTIFDGDYLYNPNEYIMIISCPKLAAVSINATYQSYNKQVTDTTVREDWNMRKVLIDGFKQDSLTISQDYGSTMLLSNNHFGAVNGSIGLSQKSGSKLIVLGNNKINQANFDIRHKSALWLYDALINNLNYHLTDSAKVVLVGKAQNLINKSNLQQK